MVRETDVKGHERKTSYGVVRIKKHKRKVKGSKKSPPSRRQTGRIEDPRIKKIEITRAEGRTEETGITHTFDNFIDANRQLSLMASSAPDTGAYDKTDFKITLKDGSVYEGRFDLQREHFLKRNLLQDHIKPQLLAYSEIKPPAHFSDAQWRQFKVTNEPHLKNSSTEWLKAFGWHPDQ